MVPGGPAGQHAQVPTRDDLEAHLAGAAQQRHDGLDRGHGAIPSVEPPNTSTGAVMSASDDSCSLTGASPWRARCPGEAVVELPEGAAGYAVIWAVKRSTAPICARKSASSRWVAIAIGLVTSFCTDVSWNAHRTSGVGAPPSAR